MSPEEFGRALDVLMKHATPLVMLPLAEMAAYCERVEQLGELPGNNFTAKRRETCAHVARMVAAVEHLRVTAAMGGE